MFKYQEELGLTRANTPDPIKQQECWLEVDHAAEAAEEGLFPAYCHRM